MNPLPESIAVTLIDDDPIDRRILRSHLEEAGEGIYSIEEFDDPNIALSAIAVSQPDVLLVDYRMSCMDGEELLRALRAKGLRVPAVLCSGESSKEGLRAALRAGFSDFIEKRLITGGSIHRCLSNVVEKARLKESLHLYQEKLEESVYDLRRQNEEILSFYHTLSHELKTPLTSITEFLSIIAEGICGPTTSDQDDLLKTALKSCRQMTSLVNDLIDTSRMETGKLAVQKSDVDLRDLVTSGARTLRTRMEEQEIELVCDAGDAPLPVHVDEGRITQVISNLLSNAMKFTPAGGLVTIKCQASGDAECVVVVEDSGTGIAEQDQVRVFERLYQSDRNDAFVQGSGLGLFISSQILDLHEGRIWVESELGTGSRFSFTLPLRAAVPAYSAE